MADTAPYRYCRKAKKAPRQVRHLSIQEVFADLAAAGEEALAKRQKFREASKGEPPTREWRHPDPSATQTVLANTRSEARALFNKMYGPLWEGETPVEVTSNKQKDAP